jgi:hypothetical protein
LHVDTALGTGAGERRDSGRERGRQRTNLLPVVAQADLDAGRPLDVAAEGARKGRCDLPRQEGYASAVNPAAPNSLTAASNSTSLCSAPMTSHNSLTIGIL